MRLDQLQIETLKSIGVIVFKCSKETPIPGKIIAFGSKDPDITLETLRRYTATFVACSKRYMDNNWKFGKKDKPRIVLKSLWYLLGMKSRFPKCSVHLEHLRAASQRKKLDRFHIKTKQISKSPSRPNTELLDDTEFIDYSEKIEDTEFIDDSENTEEFPLLSGIDDIVDTIRDSCRCPDSDCWCPKAKERNKIRKLKIENARKQRKVENQNIQPGPINNTQKAFDINHVKALGVIGVVVYKPNLSSRLTANGEILAHSSKDPFVTFEVLQQTIDLFQRCTEAYTSGQKIADYNSKSFKNFIKHIHKLQELWYWMNIESPFPPFRRSYNGEWTEIRPKKVPQLAFSQPESLGNPLSDQDEDIHTTWYKPAEANTSKIPNETIDELIQESTPIKLKTCFVVIERVKHCKNDVDSMNECETGNMKEECLTPIEHVENVKYTAMNVDMKHECETEIETVNHVKETAPLMNSDVNVKCAANIENNPTMNVIKEFESVKENFHENAKKIFHEMVNVSKKIQKIQKINTAIIKFQTLASKTQAKLDRNEEKKRKWMGEVNNWRTRHSKHPDYHANHPEEQKFRAAQKDLEKLTLKLTDKIDGFHQSIATLLHEQSRYKL